MRLIGVTCWLKHHKIPKNEDKKRYKYDVRLLKTVCCQTYCSCILDKFLFSTKKA